MEEVIQVSRILQVRRGGVINNVQGKWKSKIAMLEKKLKNQKSQLSVFNAADKLGSDNEESD